MNKNSQIFDFERVARAIAFINRNFKDQPSLKRVAEEVGLSEFHFQRLFKEWAGISPKKFLQFLTVENVKRILEESNVNLLEAAYESGLSGTGRLHDLFVKIEGMTPGEYKNRGKSLKINYSFGASPFGDLLIASTDRGVCYMSFAEKDKALSDLIARFEDADFFEKNDEFQGKALKIYQTDWSDIGQIKLHLKGSEFQMKVWESLLKIPAGKLVTYGKIAKSIGYAKASRAVGSAVGANPVAFLIPCHRVINASGILGNYRWGPVRKQAMIGWEMAFKS